jgi:methylmalonyl-CoA/ethylmalonyl-CoA epimerase
MTGMQSFGLKFHHLGLASRHEDRAVRFLEGLGYSIGERVFDPLQNVYLCLCRADAMPDVEIVTPTNSPGPLDNILKTADAMIYHSCYETRNLDESLRAMRESGHRVICVSSPKSAVLFNGRHVSFYAIRGFGLIELLEPS